jgi:hypothetical protein
MYVTRGSKMNIIYLLNIILPKISATRALILILSQEYVLSFKPVYLRLIPYDA